MAIDFTELLKISREAQRVDRERAELFSPMVRGVAWPEYVSLLNSRLQALSDQLLIPGSEHTEYIKGAMYGIMLCRDLPSAIIESMIPPSVDESETSTDD